MAGEVVRNCSSCKHSTSTGCGSSASLCLSGLTSNRFSLWRARSPSRQKPPANSGEHAEYYEVDITRPKSGGAAYMAECQDIIEALKMDFNEGNAFKALWRRAAARLGNVKKGNEDPLYDAQKIKFYGTRILEQEENK